MHHGLSLSEESRSKYAYLLHKFNPKLTQKEVGERAHIRQSTVSKAYERWAKFEAEAEAHLSRIIRVDLKGELFTYTIDDIALAHARLMDGKLLLATNAREPSAQRRSRALQVLGRH